MKPTEAAEAKAELEAQHFDGGAPSSTPDTLLAPRARAMKWLSESAGNDDLEKVKV